MATNFGFGSLTFNGKTITLADIQEYAKKHVDDGKLDAVEYKMMLKDFGMDGFNGVCTFGSMDKNHDGKITEDEFKIMEQKVAMGEYLDGELEAKADDPESGYTPDLKNAAISFLKGYADTYLIAHPGDVDNMLEQFKTDLTKFFDNYQAGLEKIEDIRKNNKYGKAFLDAVKDGNKNGYIDSAEREAINTAAADYALQQILIKSDYSFLTDMGVKSSDISAIKSLVGKLYTSGNVGDNLTAITAKIKDSVAKCDDAKIVDEATKLQAQKDAEEAAKNAKPAAVYTVNSIDLDYSGIKGYNEKSTVTTTNDEKGIKAQAAKTIDESGLKDQLKAKIKEKCAAQGLNFDEALVDSIFDSAKTVAMDSCIKSEDVPASWGPSNALQWWVASWRTDRSFNVKTLIDTFVSKFNELMTKATEKLAAGQADANGVPTFDYITSSYLGVPDKDPVTGVELTKDQKAMKALQEELLANPDGKIGGSVAFGGFMAFIKPNVALATQIVDIVGADIIEQMKKAGVSETVLTNLISQSKDEVLAKVTSDTKKIDLVKDFVALVQQKYADYKTSRGAGMTA